MENANRESIERLLDIIKKKLDDVKVLKNETNDNLLFLEVIGSYKGFKIGISEILHEQNRKYAYYVFNGNNVVVGFDNSPDREFQKLEYGIKDWKNHQRERVPHKHDNKIKRKVLTDEISVEGFIDWLERNIEKYKETENISPSYIF